MNKILLSILLFFLAFSLTVVIESSSDEPIIRLNVDSRNISTDDLSIVFETPNTSDLNLTSVVDVPEALIKFSYNGSARFYVDGSYRGFGYSISVKKSEIPEGTSICVDVDFDNFCDMTFSISKAQIEIYDEINLVGSPIHYGENIRPDLVTSYVSRIEATNISDFSVASDVWSWLKTYFHYQDDEVTFGIGDYWSLPNETLSLRRGDCEDWTITFLSLIENIRPTTKCYGLVTGVPTGHVFAMCNFDNTFYIFDQGFRKSKPASAYYLIRDYAGHWGIDNITVYSAFNMESTFQFQSTEEFAEWMENT